MDIPDGGGIHEVLPNNLANDLDNLYRRCFNLALAPANFWHAEWEPSIEFIEDTRLYLLFIEEDFTEPNADSGALVSAACVVTTDDGSRHLYNVCTDPAYQRQGHGRFLLNSIITSEREQMAPGLVFTLEVDIHNSGAIKLYTSLGFQVTESFPGPDPRGDGDYLVMINKIR